MGVEMLKNKYIKRAELPVSCPLKEDEVWNIHPRVYLSFDEKQEVSCPYCGTKFILKE